MCSCGKSRRQRCKGPGCVPKVAMADIEFDTDVVALPQQITLPRPVANQSGRARTLTLDKAVMILPQPIVDYLTQHPTYGQWVIQEG